ncbi:MAG: YraN family protein [Candidatus Moraniibacteriota bacterium]|nr:MAG: YraN family protein [Candidatus Moranbacteria bacterium]
MLPFSLLQPFRHKRSSLGKSGERTAALYLKNKGFKILEMNYRNPRGKQLGEIDIIAKKGDTIVFVEVKTRKGEMGTVFPEDNLTPGKLRKLEKIATYYLQSRHLRDSSYHFDAVTILIDKTGSTTIRHFEHIFV